MSKVYLEDSNLTNIANAIRSKNGETTTYKPSEMATAIENIPSGGTEVDIQDYLYFSYPFTTKPSSEYIDLSNAFTNGSYTFVEDTDLKVLKSNSNYNVNNGICYCYIKIDCTNTKAKINIKSYVSSENNFDYGLIYYTKTLPTSYPNRTNVTNWNVGTSNSYGTLLGKNSGNNARIDIENKVLEDGVYYLVYGYIKDSSGNTYLDRYFIEKINIEIGYDKYTYSDFNYAYLKYPNTISILEALNTFKNENPNSKLYLSYCFNKDNALLTQSNVDAFNTYKDVFKNVVSYKYLFGNLNGSYGGLCPTDFGTYFIVDKNTIDLYGMFSGFKTLNYLDVSNYKTFNVIDMSYMFNDCKKLTSLDVSNFNTSNVVYMNYMFYGCNNLTSLDVSNFNTSNVTSMNYMFYDCSGLTSLDVSNFNTSNVTIMNYMFCGCNKLTSLDVSNFNTSKVTSFSLMFNNCNKLTSLDVSNFNTSSCKNMSQMFNGCNNLTSLDVSNFNTSNATDISGMFSNCNNLTSLDVSNFNTSNVVYMNGMFYNCNKLTSLDVSNFNTNKVTSMSNIFYGCSGLTSLKLGSKFSPKVSTISMFNTSTNQYIDIDMNGNTNFSKYSGSSTLNLANIWREGDSACITLYENFANSLGTKNSSYTRTIKIYTYLYNVLTDTQKSLITNKGYTLSYGTS